MIKIIFMNGSPLEIEFETIKNMTIREFMLELGKIKPDFINGNNFEYSLICNKRILNDFNNRHNIVKDFIEPDDHLFTSCWALGSPIHKHRFENNLCPSKDLRNEICSYCDLPNNSKQNDVIKYSCVLECNHSFHYKCIFQHKSIKCILCCKQIGSDKKTEIIMMSRNL